MATLQGENLTAIMHKELLCIVLNESIGLVKNALPLHAIGGE